ncbi:MAG: MotA/TolQ/ExbB proton channel family protein [Planctomycetota bacterium]
MKTIILKVLAFFIAGAAMLQAQDRSEIRTDSFEHAAATVQQNLEESLADLSALRERIAAEKIPSSRKLSELESELVKVRLEFQKTSRLLDSRTLDLTNLGTEIKSRKDETTYLSNLLGEYIRNLESRMHISELQRYEKVLEAAKLAPENSNLSEQEVQQAQAGLLDVSLDRLFDALGGSRFEGTAVDSNGLMKNGTFVLVGPVALFRSMDGTEVGTAEQRLGSLEPAVIGFENPRDREETSRLLTASAGLFPLDPSLGNAHKIEATHESLWEHIRKGGAVMVPIFIMAGAALLVALYKWLALVFLRKPSKQQIRALLSAVADHEGEAAVSEVAKIKGPVGRMLTAGVEHLKESRELIEEVMYEKVLTTRLKLMSFLPFIAICAASAPLLGLLGTVTGIINTFKLITVFGSGDVKTLSGGISEALITTEFGLIVAIPSLLIHAFLSRKARGMISYMETTAIAFVNHVSMATDRRALSHIADNEERGFNRTEEEPREKELATLEEKVIRLRRELADPAET